MTFYVFLSSCARFLDHWAYSTDVTVIHVLHTQDKRTLFHVWWCTRHFMNSSHPTSH